MSIISQTNELQADTVAYDAQQAEVTDKESGQPITINFTNIYSNAVKLAKDNKEQLQKVANQAAKVTAIAFAAMAFFFHPLLTFIAAGVAFAASKPITTHIVVPSQKLYAKLDSKEQKFFKIISAVVVGLSLSFSTMAIGLGAAAGYQAKQSNLAKLFDNLANAKLPKIVIA